ncbi:MAG: hydroxysqualene dehydroxylase HpnE [Alphaproteobacteria bacterium]
MTARSRSGGHRIDSAAGGKVHVVGAGLAGLAAAVTLAGDGRAVVLYESGTHAGGRCRSFHDAELGVRIDNGNHLLLSGNRASLSYVERIGALDTFDRTAEASIPFIDLADGTRWEVRPSRGPVPWWILRTSRRVPGTRPRDYLAARRLGRAASGDTVAAILDRDTTLFRRLWQPLVVAALNTAADQASAVLFSRIVAETLGRGAAACRPMLPRDGLSESLVDPALEYLTRHGGEIRFGSRLKALDIAAGRVAALRFDDACVAVPLPEQVVLAVPAHIAARIVPGLVVPDDYAPIVNAHFRYDAPAGSPPFVGIIGGVAEWVFRKRSILSVTVSAADRLVGMPADELRDLLWRDVARALALSPAPTPPSRIVKERRATFRATPAQQARRPHAGTAWNNLHLAGDYIDTGLPATIEGAIRSGIVAAGCVTRGRDSELAPAGFRPPASSLPTTAQDRERAMS